MQPSVIFLVCERDECCCDRLNSALWIISTLLGNAYISAYEKEPWFLSVEFWDIPWSRVQWRLIHLMPYFLWQAGPFSSKRNALHDRHFSWFAPYPLKTGKRTYMKIKSKIMIIKEWSEVEIAHSDLDLAYITSTDWFRLGHSLFVRPLEKVDKCLLNRRTVRSNDSGDYSHEVQDINRQGGCW